MSTQLSIDFGVTEEEACMMCHLSSECGGCCAKCGMKCSSVQLCSQSNRGSQTERLKTWLYLVNKYRESNVVAHKVLTPEQIKRYKIKRL